MTPDELNQRRRDFESFLAEQCEPCSLCLGPRTFLHPVGQDHSYAWCEHCDRGELPPQPPPQPG